LASEGQKRRSRCQRLVGEQHHAVAVEAELELRVREQEAACFGVRRGEPVERERRLPRRIVGRLPAESRGVDLGDVEVVALDRLGGGRHDRLREPLRLDEPHRQPVATHRARVAVLGPPEPGYP
jgi:hypothetical protein